MGMISMIKKTLREKLLIRENINGKHLVVVDIQPEYKDGFEAWLNDFIIFLEENQNNFSEITFLYNGPDLGFPDEQEYKNWWYEMELNENIIYGSNFFDKGYAYFRYCMDSGMDDEAIVNLIRYMMEMDVNDSRELNEEFWNGFIETYGNNDIRELMEYSDDCLIIPDLMEELIHLDNIVLCGGGKHQCLKEVELALDALGKPYDKLKRFIY